ncbi:MAG: filamentous hemagglutinin N-terminal domain-containing protein, partial [Pseudomonadota bacterium]
TPDNGVSINSFDRFNVPVAGAAFDNTTQGASASVADVTGTEASRMEGTLEVLGARADVIVANPNGFTLNGARYQNIRGLVIVAGRRQAGTLDYDVAVGDGSIEIGSGGVVADVRRMDLIARTIRIDGNVGETDSTPFLRFNATAGTGRATINPNAVSVDSVDYITLSGRSQDTGPAVSLTLSEGAIVSGGRLTLTADGRGAGVVMAGQGLASAGEFTMSADGRISLGGATAEGLTGVSLKSQDIDIIDSRLESDFEDVVLAADAQLTMVDTNISGTDISLSAGSDASVVGGTVDALQDLSVAAQSLTLTTLSENSIATLRAQGNADLTFGGDLTNNTGFVQAFGDLDVSVGGTLLNVLNLDDRNESVAGLNLATLQANGDLSLTAARLNNLGGLIRSGSAMTLGGGDITNALARVGQVRTARSCFLFLCRSYAVGAFQFSGGGIESDARLEIDLTGEFLNRGGTISALSGLSLQAASIDFQPLRYSNIYTLPKGPSTLFFGQRTRRIATFETGKIFAPLLGFSVIARSGPARFVGTDVEPLALLDGVAGAEIVAVPPEVIGANGRGFGVFSQVLN